MNKFTGKMYHRRVWFEGALAFSLFEFKSKSG